MMDVQPLLERLAVGSVFDILTNRLDKQIRPILVKSSAIASPNRTLLVLSTNLLVVSLLNGLC